LFGNKIAISETTTNQGGRPAAEMLWLRDHHQPWGKIEFPAALETPRSAKAARLELATTTKGVQGYLTYKKRTPSRTLP